VCWRVFLESVLESFPGECAGEFSWRVCWRVFLESVLESPAAPAARADAAGSEIPSSSRGVSLREVLMVLEDSEFFYCAGFRTSTLEIGV
jgi:hypothetical protein